jgi:Rhs element Vgr protein
MSTTPPSPQLLSGSLTTFTVSVNGQAIPSTFQVVSVDTRIFVNRLPKARIALYDGSPASQDFPISDLSLFLPGNSVSIAAGYNQSNTVIFTGVIVSQSIEIERHSGSRLIVDLTDPAMVMTLERRNAVFTQTTDSALINTLITNNGLSGTVSTTSTVYPDIVQYYATDWDLMVMRAELNGFVVIANGGQITVESPNTSAQPALMVEYGDSIFELNAVMDASTQYTSSAIMSYAWDESTQSMLESGPAALNVTQPGNVSSDSLAATFNVQSYTQQTGAMIPSSGLQDWSTAELLKSRLSKIRGQVRFQGSALATAGAMIQLSGIGNRFNGAAFIGGVHHNISEGRWTTTVTFGLAWPWFSAEAPCIPAPQASGQLPPIQGLQTGIVQQVATDPDGEFRVQVTFPILGASAQGVWARLSTFYASNGIGAVFFPEVNDEVVVGFMNNDPRFPVILGSVYSKPLPPPSAYSPTQANNMKALVTRSNLKMTFDDQNVIFQVVTPGSRTISLDDKAGTITVSDGNSNSITLSSSGITINSGKDLTLKATGSVTISAGSALSMSATGNATLSGAGITQSADGAFAAKGASVTVSGSGITTITGAMVNIN